MQSISELVVGALKIPIYVAVMAWAAYMMRPTPNRSMPRG
jgi:hypothetical protein